MQVTIRLRWRTACPPSSTRSCAAGEGRILRKLHRIADQVNALEDDFVGLSDAELRARDRHVPGAAAPTARPSTTCCPRRSPPSARRPERTLGQRHFDVQLMGGAALHLGNIAEMKTGEGKTLVGDPAGLPQRAVRQGRPRRHRQRLPRRARRRVDGPGAPLPRPDVGVILSNMRPAERREAYACDITYGTNNEFGFDYLRDNMAWTPDDLVQRGHNFAIVDEVDSILIDEARTPLIISGPADQPHKWYVEFASSVAAAASATRLRGRREEAHRRRPRGRRQQGRGPARHRQPLRVGQHPARRLPQQRDQGQGAVQARQGLRRHERRGADRRRAHRSHPAGRRYNEGMHQAIEAKEGVEIKQENQTLATITLQNYFRLYDKLGGHDRYGA